MTLLFCEKTVTANAANFTDADERRDWTRTSALPSVFQLTVSHLQAFISNPLTHWFWQLNNFLSNRGPLSVPPDWLIIHYSRAAERSAGLTWRGSNGGQRVSFLEANGFIFAHQRKALKRRRPLSPGQRRNIMLLARKGLVIKPP